MSDVDVIEGERELQQPIDDTPLGKKPRPVLFALLHAAMQVATLAESHHEAKLVGRLVDEAVLVAADVRVAQPLQQRVLPWQASSFPPWTSAFCCLCSLRQRRQPLPDDLLPLISLKVLSHLQTLRRLELNLERVADGRRARKERHAADGGLIVGLILGIFL